MGTCETECVEKNHPGMEHEEWVTQNERIALPEKFHALLNEAINDLYKKVCDEGEELVNAHKEKRIPVAVFRSVYETQTLRIGDAGMLIQWFRQGFRMESV